VPGPKTASTRCGAILKNLFDPGSCLRPGYNYSDVAETGRLRQKLSNPGMRGRPVAPYTIGILAHS